MWDVSEGGKIRKIVKNIRKIRWRNAEAYHVKNYFRSRKISAFDDSFLIFFFMFHLTVNIFGKFKGWECKMCVWVECNKRRDFSAQNTVIAWDGMGKWRLFFKRRATFLVFSWGKYLEIFLAQKTETSWSLTTIISLLVISLKLFSSLE